jgi:Ca2+-transporting ATPase
MKSTIADVRGAWHTADPEEVATTLRVDRTSGLDPRSVEEARTLYGPNVLVRSRGTSPLKILWEQFTATLVLILIAAAGLSAYLGKTLEAVAIVAIVVLFGLLGFFQEFRAERAIAALRAMSTPLVRVRRGGQILEISAEQIVAGDVVLLEAGAVVPADMRLVEVAGLRIQEAALTGESEPVDKSVDRLTLEEVPLGDRVNMAYMGTSVTYGRGSGIVTSVGMATELGKVAGLIQGVEQEATPLQVRLNSVGRMLAFFGVGVAAVVGGLGLAVGESVEDVLLTAISTMVAVVPEGLPAVVTLTLAMGSQRMLRRNALIRKLPAVETLGSVTVICSDKTGTLTQNRMTVTCVDVAGHRTTVEELVERGHVSLEPTTPVPSPAAAVRLTLLAGALCNDASIQLRPEDGEQVTIGDPTETALLVAAARSGVDLDELSSRFPRVGELPFDSDRKRMTTVHRLSEQGWSGFDTQYIAFVKGAVDGLLDQTSHVWLDDRPIDLDQGWKERILLANDELAEDGMRVLGVAMKPTTGPEADKGLEENLTFLGLVGIIDPPRQEVADAVERCLTAGIRTVMITGDHPKTALAIARRLGIRGSGALSGVQLELMDRDALIAAVADVSVFARVSPEHKLRIVDAFSARNEVVAMTGDGVNDAPALRQAHIGVAMGITGTDVAKEAADMVLRDDNFTTIVSAVEEGRVIYDNLRRFISYAVAGNIGKVLVMLVWPLPFIATGVVPLDPVALLPLQLLWLNLMTDGLLGLSLGAEPADRDVMNRRPMNPSAGIFSEGLGRHTVATGLWIGAIALGVGFWYHETGDPAWQTVMFTSLAMMQLVQAFAVRSHNRSVLGSNLLGNRVMNVMVPLVLLVQVIAIYLPGLSDRVLGLTPLTVADWGVAILSGLVFLAGPELWKRAWRQPTLRS